MGRMQLEVGFSTDVGRHRQRNEDSYAIFVPYPGEGNPSQLAGLMLVADGMGGERAGDRASRIAAERLKEWFATGTYRGWPEFSGPNALEAALGKAIRKVSHEIYQLGENDPSIRGLGSTVVIALATASRLVLGHVGDSRCYRLRDATLELLTTDHSWVQRQVDAGVITAEAARSHPQRNILTRSLGDSLPPDVDMTTVDLRHGDVFMLCSDGLTGGLTDPEILDMALRHPSPQALAEALVRQANDQDGSDNITCVVGRALEEGKEYDEELENRTTHRLMLDDDFYEGETRVDIPVPDFDNRPATDWRAWLAVGVVALALGLLAGWLVQQTQGSVLHAEPLYAESVDDGSDTAVGTSRDAEPATAATDGAIGAPTTERTSPATSEGPTAPSP